MTKGEIRGARGSGLLNDEYSSDRQNACVHQTNPYQGVHGSRNSVMGVGR